MKNEKTSETLNESIENSMKWFKESTAAMTHAYDKQIEFAKDLYGKALETTFESGMGPFGDSLGMTNAITKTLENFTKFSNAYMESFRDFARQNGSSVLSKQTADSILSTYNKQMETIKELTEKQFDYLKTEFKSMQEAISPLLEKSKVDLESHFDSSAKAMKSITSLYEKRMLESTDSNKEMMAEVNAQMNTLLAASQKIWSDLLRATTAEAEKTTAASKTAAHETGKTAVHETGKKVHSSSKR